ncbi:MAG: hypothetical protein ACOYNI_10280 [Acidimicrobiia bacterium]
MSEELRALLQTAAAQLSAAGELEADICAAVDEDLLNGPLHLVLEAVPVDLDDDDAVAFQLDLNTYTGDNGLVWAVAYAGKVPDECVATYELRGSIGWSDFVAWTDGEVGLMVADAGFAVGPTVVRRYAVGLVAAPDATGYRFDERMTLAPAEVEDLDTGLLRVAMRLTPAVNAVHAVAVSEHGSNPWFGVALDAEPTVDSEEALEAFSDALRAACEHADVDFGLDSPFLFLASGTIGEQVRAVAPALVRRGRGTDLGIA